MATTESVEQLIEHFRSVFSQRIREAGEALQHGDWSAFDAIRQSVASSRITAAVYDRVSSSSDDLARFQDLTENPVKQILGPKAIGGFVVIATGATLYKGAATIAVGLGGAAGATVLIEFIGLLLLLLGIYIVFKPVWDVVKERILLLESQLQALVAF